MDPPVEAAVQSRDQRHSVDTDAQRLGEDAGLGDVIEMGSTGDQIS